MGWAGGSSLFSSLIDILKGEIPHDRRVKVYLRMIDAFRADDWDTTDECLGVDDAYDEAYEEFWGDDIEEEEEIVKSRPLPPEEYAGQWIAISADNTKILAHGDTLVDVREYMYKAGIDDASYEKLPPLKGRSK